MPSKTSTVLIKAQVKKFIEHCKNLVIQSGD